MATSRSAAVRTCARARASLGSRVGVALVVFLDRVAEVRPVDPGAYDEVPVMWAHGPRQLLVELSPA